ncbi:MAG: hypothetical protein QMD77_01720 [Patescibacteria group bacterium]|nr:hypothetical protein [Patescibacteria group bacterium]
MNKLCDKVLCKIREEKIEPKPRWQFLLKDYFVWSAFVSAVVVGGLAFCVAFSLTVDNDWDIYKYLKISPVQHFLISLPYVWLILIILFLGLAFYNYKHTKGGYRRGTFVILGLSVVGSVILGSIFHSLGMGRKIDKIFARNLPLYQKIHCCCNRKGIWSQPEKGLLGGRILKVKEENEFDMEDFSGIVWQIEKNNQTFMRGPVLIIENEEVKLIGEKKAEKIFWAREIRPWSGWESEE